MTQANHKILKQTTGESSFFDWYPYEVTGKNWYINYCFNSRFLPGRITDHIVGHIGTYGVVLAGAAALDLKDSMKKKEDGKSSGGSHLIILIALIVFAYVFASVMDILFRFPGWLIHDPVYVVAAPFKVVLVLFLMAIYAINPFSGLDFDLRVFFIEFLYLVGCVVALIMWLVYPIASSLYDDMVEEYSLSLPEVSQCLFNGIIKNEFVGLSGSDRVECIGTHTLVTRFMTDSNGFSIIESDPNNSSLPFYPKYSNNPSDPHYLSSLRPKW